MLSSAIPANQRLEYREAGVTAPGEAEAKAIVGRVLEASRADEVEVRLDAGSTAHLRFARNTPSTSGVFDDLTLTITSSLGRRSASVKINQTDANSIQAGVARSEALARLAPEDPEHLPALGPQAFRTPTYAEVPLALDAAAHMAEGTSHCVTGARERGLVAAGFSTARAAALAIGNSRGLFGYQRSNVAAFSETVRSQRGRGSGWASSVANGVASLDYAGCSTLAIDKALRSVEPRSLAPGKYVTILEPACVANLLAVLTFNLSARGADEGRSFFSAPGGGNRVGEQLFPEALSVHSDPADLTAPGFAWGDDAVPQAPRDWVKAGTLTNLAYDRFWARKNEREAVPLPTNAIMSGGEGKLDELVASTDRGLLITSLWYIRSVDPQTMLVTGLTRDGVFWIEKGKIAYPVTNFRFNESPVRVFKAIEAMTETVRVSPRAWNVGHFAAPAIRVKEFELSSVSDAV